MNNQAPPPLLNNYASYHLTTPLMASGRPLILNCYLDSLLYCQELNQQDNNQQFIYATPSASSPLGLA